ncbi:hypothetical protein [Spirilliplanes yamanashiensis]|uniref:Signal transduction histidine kinase n=1 Tax=Spirilliplanes yamanashiensis TaxID=42233 RepID=A0A8J4DM81_9ACTN|nr:hypothetical protein [Spirilliplanes yamanashiensis]MDP9816353.1 hypothetical protein [Spirilliplanes yamanashiensis]GIJ05880.1 hypothetical protein Sya03_52320 [Spirilliplanes yamanashiensis]
MTRLLPAAVAAAALATLAAAAAGPRALVLAGAAATAALAAALLLAARDRGTTGAPAVDRRVEERRAADVAGLAQRRVAAQLRDRVLEDLAGVGYALGHPGADQERLAAVVQETIRTLRQVLLDVQPPALTGDTLATALDDLTAGLRMAGVRCVVRVPAGLPVTPAGAGLLHRAAREALRERGEALVAAREALRPVAVAAGSAAVELTAERTPGAVTLTVTGAQADPVGEGPALLARDVAAAGGTLTVAPDGTRLVVTVPAA